MSGPGYVNRHANGIDWRALQEEQAVAGAAKPREGHVRWDWVDDETLPHRGEYVVRQGSEVVARCGPFKADYERAVRIAAALNESDTADDD